MGVTQLYDATKSKRPGELQYRCRNCGAIVREHKEDVSFIPNNSLQTSHECYANTDGMIELISITFDSESE